jgi:uncharacterized membrane protein (DUF2068 family)
MVDVTVDRDTKGGSEAVARRGDLWLWMIAIFKLIKGALLLALGIAALSMLHKDVAERMSHWISVIRVDPDNYYIHRLLAKLSLVNDRKLEEISAGTFFYSGLLLTEGIGLSFRKRWAEYFTVITTGSLVPLEIYELIHKFSIAKIVVLLVNLAIVWYLIDRLRERKEE